MLLIYKEFFRGRVVMKPNSPELQEAHAFRVANTGHHQKSAPEMAAHIKSKKNYEHLDSERTVAAVAAIDKLIALGVRQQEIGKLIQQSIHFKPLLKRKDAIPPVFSLNEQRTSTEIEKLGLSEADLEKLVVAHRTERSIARLRAMQIAQEELKKMALLQQLT